MQIEAKLNRSDGWAMASPHFHDGFELLLSLTDGGSFFVGRHVYPLRRGTLLLMDSALHRSIGDGTHYERYVLHFSRETLSALATEQTNFPARLESVTRSFLLDEEQMIRFVERMDICCAPLDGFGADVRQKIAFLELLLEVCSLLNQTDFMTVVPTRLRGRIEDVLEYIQKNLAAPLSLDLLAEQFFLSKYYLCRLFREETGFSVGDYIIRCRIQRACALLRGQMNVQQAGEAVGFQNNAHFIRTFGRITGVSPGRYHHQFSCPTES